MIKDILNKLTTDEIREILLHFGQPADLNRFDEVQQILYAGELLKTHTTKKTADRLMVKYHISRSTAYRRIATASQNYRYHETKLCSNIIIPGVLKSRVTNDG